ncbi:MAG: DUF6110 family protein [Clostridiales Family XIII bacterium]|jgi:hypothetical protein|nr:DUF6110 family protein [Clostridiales Family XIII bacterium]
MELPNKTFLITFVGGAAAALAARAFAKSKTAHKLAVRGVAGGLRVRDNALKKVETIREEAQDIYEEARRAPETAE